MPIQPLDYATEAPTPPRVWLARGQVALALYPLLVAAGIYGQYGLSWLVLGYPPSTWGADDPKSVPIVSWLHPLTGLLLVGLFPALATFACATAAAVVVSPRRFVQHGLVLLVGVALWAGGLFAMLTDPGGILRWWMD